jgi:hypothetical protein
MRAFKKQTASSESSDKPPALLKETQHPRGLRLRDQACPRVAPPTEGRPKRSSGLAQESGLLVRLGTIVGLNVTVHISIRINIRWQI